MVLSAAQIRECEALTMRNESLASIDLMERAAARFVEALQTAVEVGGFAQVAIFVGSGNNGGDGLAAARMLALQGVNVTVVTCFAQSALSLDCAVNLKRVEAIAAERENCTLIAGTHSLRLPAHTLAIDALFGIGLSREIAGERAEMVRVINACDCVVALDVPSGLFIDGHTPENSPVVRATLTLTFQFVKLAFLLPENAERVGQCKVLDIGLQCPETLQPQARLIHSAWLSPLLKRPQKFDHKGSNGCGLLVAGSDDMPGAAILSACAAMRSGLGKVVVHTSAKVADLLMMHLPEALIDRDKESCFSQLDLEAWPAAAVAVGPGLGTSVKTAAALKNLLDEVRVPLLLDADALNILSRDKTWLAFLPPNSVLTPHFKEFERLAGPCPDDFARLEKLKAFARDKQAVVVLKGAHTAVALPDGTLFFNTTGNPGMATAGAGDVLAGMLLAFLAKGYPAAFAACFAVYLHGLAGDFVLNHQSCESLLASDIVRHIGEAFKSLDKEN